jgi:protocatechuate 3,4-dioxygenase beta subunit
MTTDHTTSFTRRRLLRQAGVLGLAAAGAGSLGAEGGLAALATTSSPKLALTPEQEEGPFYVALEKIRKNITLGRPGIPLRLQLKVEDAAGKPVESAACDIWHCDALGIYSDESSESTVGQTWLRGVQLTDATGLAEFQTIYPGHYQGRTTHVHVKVHVGGKISGSTYTGGHVSHTGQLLFDDGVSTSVYEAAPYTSDTAARVLNAQDAVYQQQHGSKVLLKLTRLGAAVSDGFAGAITLVVDPAATPALIGARS